MPKGREGVVERVNLFRKEEKGKAVALSGKKQATKKKNCVITITGNSRPSRQEGKRDGMRALKEKKKALTPIFRANKKEKRERRKASPVSY